MSIEGLAAASFFGRQAARLQGTNMGGPNRARGAVPDVAAEMERRLKSIDVGKLWTSGRTTYGPGGGRAVTRASAARQLQGWAIARDEDLQVAQFTLIQTIAKPVAQAFERRFIPFAEAATAQWPVRTGFSRSQMFATFNVKGNEARATLGNGAPYAFYVRFGPQKRIRGKKTREEWVNGGEEVRSYTDERGQRVYYELLPDGHRTDGFKTGGHAWTVICRKPLTAVSIQIADDIGKGI